MKQIMFGLFFIVFAQMSFSQVSKDDIKIDTVSINKKYVYCEIVGNESLLSTKLKIDIDYGQDVSFWNPDRRLKDENGKSIKFNSMVDALNYMGSFGWEFVQAYVITTTYSGGQYNNVLHWLLKRELQKK
ncbi:MAG: hypothetical protein H6Q17_1077 [Bacteroidetes bacterium]|nr:hypothetical protein [Bacteroidota bacterium]